MIKASRNQLGNTKNPYQGDAKRVLCICSAGLLRSPTAANVLHQKYGFNTRAAGAAGEYALIPVTEALLRWADLVVLLANEHLFMLDEDEKKIIEGKLVQLQVPDEHEWNNEDLKKEILVQFEEKYNG